MNRSKGDAAERDLSNWLEDEAGYYAQRTAASGSATDRARPDVIAAAGGVDGRPRPRVLLVEVKAFAAGTGQLDGAEVDALVEAADRAGGEPWIAVKPDLRSFASWFCFPARTLGRTGDGNVYLGMTDRETAVDRQTAFAP